MPLDRESQRGEMGRDARSNEGIWSGVVSEIRCVGNGGIPGFTRDT